MSRPKKARDAQALADQHDADTDTQSLTDAGQALAEQGSNILAIEQKYDVGLAYALDVYVTRIRQYAAESAMRLIEIGRLLIIMREHEAPDAFAAALTRTGMSRRFAQRCMQAAVKLQDKPMLQKLGVSKALELLAEDDDTLEDLEAGGTLADKTLGEFDAMTVRELKETLRQERADRQADKEADEKIISGKDERINKLLRKQKRRDSSTELRAKADELMREGNDALIAANSQLAHMREVHQEVDQLYQDAGYAMDQDVAERVDQNLQWAVARVQELADDLGE